LHTAGDLCQPDNHIPDVEWYEYLNPVLFLFRRPWQDSGGPGAYRGGTGTEEAWALWGADSANGTLFGQAAEIPRAGVFGGMPSGGHAYEIWREVNLASSLAEGKMAGDYAELGQIAAGSRGPEQTGYKISNLPLDRADVVYRTLGGGSGLGDCLDRAPELVVADIERGLVSAEAAKAVYGVVLGADGRTVDEAATEARRIEIRNDRRGGELLSHPPGWGAGSPRYAGCDVCRDLVSKDDWRKDAAARIAPAKEYVAGLGGWLADPKAGRPKVTEFACRECGTLLDVVVEVEIDA
jgi:N-methylhydantoinase B